MSGYFERRICDFTKRPIDAKDKASVQITLAKLDEHGRATGELDIIDISGCIRKSGEIDALLYDYVLKQ